MKKYNLPFILYFGAVICLFAGCAATQKSRVENGLYINTACQFSVHIPDGWIDSDNISDSLRNNLASLFQNKLQTIFSAPDGKSKIIISSEKTKAHWSEFKMVSDQLIEKFEKEPISSPDKEKVKTSIIDIRTFRDQIESCENHCKAQTATLTIEGTNKVKLKLTIHLIIYETSDEKFSLAHFILMAGEKRHDADLRIFNTMVDSFQSR